MKSIAPLFLVAAMAASVFNASANTPAPAPAAKAAKPDLAKGEASFGAVCAACHGADGNSGTPANPKLAQQHPEYLVKQLQEFKAGKRANAVMSGLAATLSDDDMRNIAFWVGSKAAKPGFAKDKELVALFNGFIAALERDISMGVLPYEFVSDPSKIGGASVRLITAKAARVFSKYSQVIIDQFCVPTWGYILGQAIADGELPDDPKWNEVSWTTPKSVTVDAGRDAANDRNDVEMGLLSMSELYAQRGLDFRTEMDKRASDMAFIIEKAKSTGIPVWMLYKPDFNWLQQGQNNSQIPADVADNLDLPPPPVDPKNP